MSACNERGPHKQGLSLGGLSLWSNSEKDLRLRRPETWIQVRVLLPTVILTSLLAQTFCDSVSLVYHVTLQLRSEGCTYLLPTSPIINKESMSESSPHMPSALRTALLMVGRPLFFSGPLGTRQLKPCKTWKALACMIYG